MIFNLPFSENLNIKMSTLFNVAMAIIELEYLKKLENLTI